MEDSPPADQLLKLTCEKFKAVVAVWVHCFKLSVTRGLPA